MRFTVTCCPARSLRRSRTASRASRRSGASMVTVAVTVPVAESNWNLPQSCVWMARSRRCPPPLRSSCHSTSAVQLVNGPPPSTGRADEFGQGAQDRRCDAHHSTPRLTGRGREAGKQHQQSHGDHQAGMRGVSSRRTRELGSTVRSLRASARGREKSERDHSHDLSDADLCPCAQCVENRSRDTCGATLSVVATSSAVISTEG